MSDFSDAIGYTYSIEGEEFYVLTFPTADETIFYSFSTREWQEWKSDNLTGLQGRHRGNCYAHFNDSPCVGDFATDKIYELDMDVFTDDGNTIIRYWDQAIDSQLKNLFVAHLAISYDQGIGLTSGQGSDPQSMLKVSYDNGRSWSAELWADMGAIGEYGTVTEWWQLGAGKRFYFRNQISDPVKVVVLDAFMEATLGNA